MGRYSRCSKITSAKGKKLDSGVSARKNQKIAKETSLYLENRRTADIRMRTKKMKLIKVGASKMFLDKG